MKHVLKNPANLLIMSIMVLAIAFTFSCSDDDKGSSFATCEKAGAEFRKCDAEVKTNQTLVAEMIACMADKTEAECQVLLGSKYDELFVPCVQKSGVCGDASLEECEKHFYEECGF